MEVYAWNSWICTCSCYEVGKGTPELNEKINRYDLEAPWGALSAEPLVRVRLV